MESDLEDIRNNKIETKVYRLRHRDALTWNDVAAKISNEFDMNMTIKKVKYLYDKHISKGTIVQSRKENDSRHSDSINEEWKEEMKDLVNTIKEKALKHLEIADKLLIEQADEGNTNSYFRNLPAAIAIWRNILDQINTISRRQEKIEINQKNYILNETQILQIVNQAYSKKAKESGFFIHPGRNRLEPIPEKN